MAQLTSNESIQEAHASRSQTSSQSSASLDVTYEGGQHGWDGNEHHQECCSHTSDAASHDSVSCCVAVDVHGGDCEPETVLSGVRAALEADEQLNVMLVGRPEVLNSFLEQAHRQGCVWANRCILRFATQEIEMGEHPAQAVRSKRDSSIVQGCKALKEREADAFFSAGSTGAILAAATLMTGRIHGVVRPAITYVFPSDIRPLVALDLGANADVTEEMLVQFAKMGTVYAKAVVGVSNPQVRLLNIGAEQAKGNVLYRAAYDLMSKELDNFAGNIESVDVFNHTCDVIVTDGFTGNVLLKSIEGTAKFMGRSLKQALMGSVRTKLGALLAKPALVHLKTLLNADEAGGAVLLGVRGVVMIGHGHTSSQAVKNGILACASAVQSELVQRVEAAITHGL